MPGGDALTNIIQKFVEEKTFVREAGLIPSPYYIIAADEGIRVLKNMAACCM